MAHLQYVGDLRFPNDGPVAAGIAIARELLELDDERELVARAADLTADHLGVPAAGWLRADHDTAELLVVAGAGRDRLEMRRRVAARVGWSPELQHEIRQRFAETIGVPASRIDAFGDRDIMILVAGVDAADRRAAEAIAHLAAERVGTLRAAEERDRRHRSVEEGLAWLAHELRGPLLAARAAVESVISEEPRDGRANMLRRVRAEIDASAQIIVPMLKVATGGHLVREPVDVVRLVRSIVRSLSFEAGGRRVTVSAPASLVVEVDPEVIRPAVTNVVRNALAYSPAATKVEVSVGIRSGSLEIRVRDRGAGMSAEERSIVFDRFVRGSAGEYRGGTGLGLFIVRRLIEAHGGSIDVESEEGVGTTLTLRVPATERARQLRPA